MAEGIPGAASASILSQTGLGLGLGGGGGGGLGRSHGSVAASLSPCTALPDRFYVELNPNETTVISWKKLVKDAQRNVQSAPPSHAPLGAHPALEARIAPAPEAAFYSSNKDPLSSPQPPANRFNSVIEKIERLYKGDYSSDENGNNHSDVPDDDRYDTSDSFIDDKELDEYFSVEKVKTKHNGFFVNRGKLEEINDSSFFATSGPKKRKRKDVKKLSTFVSEEPFSKKLSKTGVRIKDAARKGSLAVGSAELTNKQWNQKDSSVDKDSRELQLTVDSSRVRDDIAMTCEAKCSSPIHSSHFTSDKVALYNSKDSHQNFGNIMEGAKADCFRVPAVSCYELSGSGDSSDSSAPQTKDANSHLETLEKDIMSSDPSKIQVTQNLDTREIKFASPNMKEISPARPKRTMLDRAIHELEKAVAELHPPSLDMRELDQSSQSGGKSKRLRLPRDIKQRLAKVARLAAAKQGKISDHVIDHLMGILGHMVHVKTLKRHLKKMVEMGVSAMHEKEGRLQSIKQEVTEMVRLRTLGLEAQNIDQRGEANDQQASLMTGEKGIFSGSYKWDQATEDRICDLYEQYIEGMDEHKGPQIRKFYSQLAELWPEGWMDSFGIKHAVHRAMERKKRQNKPGNEKDPFVKEIRGDLGWHHIGDSCLIH